MPADPALLAALTVGERDLIARIRAEKLSYLSDTKLASLGVWAAAGIGCNKWRKVPLRPRFPGCGYGHSPQKRWQIGLFSHSFRFDSFCRPDS